MPVTKLNVVQGKEVVTKDILAKAICDMSDATNKLMASGLNEDAIIVLLQHSTKLSRRNLKRVLDSMSQLRADYTHL